MADHLTQLQDAFDQLATQMFASLRYISAHHAPASIPNQPLQETATNPSNESTNANAPQPETQQQQPDQEFDPDLPPRPDTPRTFGLALEELASDLVKKEKQIEQLISSLPGQGRSHEAQEQRIRELDEELRQVETELEVARKEKDELRERVENVMWKVKRW